MRKYFRMAYRTSHSVVKHRGTCEAHGEPRLTQEVARTKSSHKSPGWSSMREKRGHFLPVSRRSANHLLRAAPCVTGEGTIRIDCTSDSESCRIPKCRYYVTG